MEEIEETVVARPNKIILAFYVVLTMIGGAVSIFGVSLCAAHEPLKSSLTMLALGLLTLAGGLWLTMSYAAQRVVATAAGLRWRNGRGWHSVSWEQVTDFYKYEPALFDDEQHFGRLVVEAEGGRQIRFSPLMGGVAALQKRILQEAGERIGNTSWEPLGLRRRDFPQTFVYELREIRNGIGAFVTMAILAGLGLPLWLVTFSKEVSADLWVPSILLGIVFLFCAGFFTAQYRMARRRVHERYLVDADSFTFDNGRESVTVPWKSVIGYDFKYGFVRPSKASQSKTTPPLKMRTESGQEFEALFFLGRISLWKEIVRKYAVNGIEAQMDAECSDSLGGIAARWSGGVEGKGDRVFSAWTRSTRAVALGMPGLCGFTVVLHPLTQAILDQTLGTLPTLSLLLVPMSLAGAGVWFTKQIRVQIGKESFSYLRPWRRETLAWSEIERVEHARWVTTLYCADGSSLRFDATWLSHGSQIAPLIDERLRDAVAKRGGRLTERSAADR